MDDDTLSAQVVAVRDAIAAHYSATSRPLYLSNLGKVVSLPRSVSLRRLIENHLADEFVVVADPQMPTRIAVSPRDKRQAVQEDMTSKTAHALGLFPRSLLYAFSVDPHQRVFFRSEPPVYQVAEDAPSADFVEIPSRFRKVLPRFRSVQDLDDETRVDLERRIKQWLNDSQIDLALRTVREAGSRSNALERLLQAQNADLLDRLVIPGDIAKVLLNLP